MCRAIISVCVCVNAFTLYESKIPLAQQSYERPKANQLNRGADSSQWAFKWASQERETSGKEGFKGQEMAPSAARMTFPVLYMRNRVEIAS